MHTKIHLSFDNRFARLPEYFYTRQVGEGFAHPRSVHFNPSAAELIGLVPEAAAGEDFPRIFSGSAPLVGSEPLAMVYAGHQFGSYVPRLGDGRALLLGQVRNMKGESWDVQLKGPGRTPYSRFGDGRAVLRSCIREYLCSEAMHGLGIPTTRALCVIATNEPVLRETVEPGAVMTRLSPSHIRFGHFEYFHHIGELEAVRELADHVIDEHFPHLKRCDDRYTRWVEEVIAATARLIAQWQAIGSAHGVMNTDNMSILGLTLDYGPFGFMEAYAPGFICNHSDETGRYAFRHQPYIGLWNLHALVHALTSLVPPEKSRPLLDGYGRHFAEAMRGLARKKLGLESEREGDMNLWRDLLALLETQAADYTLFFRALSRHEVGVADAPLWSLFFDLDEWKSWEERYRLRLEAEESDRMRRQEAMLRANPKYVLRNWIAEQAIRRAQDKRDYSEISRVLRVMQAPYEEHPDAEDLAVPAPDWARELCVSCSS